MTIGDVICPIELLEHVVLQVESVDSSDTESIKTVVDFKVFDHDLSVYSFQVPENLTHIKVTLTGKVKLMAAVGEYAELNESKSFSVDR